MAPHAAEDNRRRLLDAGIPCHNWPAHAAHILALTARPAGSIHPRCYCRARPGLEFVVAA